MNPVPAVLTGLPRFFPHSCFWKPAYILLSYFCPTTALHILSYLFNSRTSLIHQAVLTCSLLPPHSTHLLSRSLSFSRDPSLPPRPAALASF